jgi:hypothetical protein
MVLSPAAVVGAHASYDDKGTTAMRTITAIAASLVLFLSASSLALAQGQSNSDAAKAGADTGRTQTPETKGEKQPQGWTGPINTGHGGAPAESPQGQSPPGMQAAPEGSSKTTVEPDKGTDTK